MRQFMGSCCRVSKLSVYCISNNKEGYFYKLHDRVWIRSTHQTVYWFLYGRYSSWRYCPMPFCENYGPFTWFIIALHREIQVSRGAKSHRVHTCLAWFVIHSCKYNKPCVTTVYTSLIIKINYIRSYALV